ncbi:DUF6223 family protein [Streptomyces sp. NRRL S-87]|uniref:DUF6223 family protein n=1 Tax=Streptomyces sp. NRRL S-87 TaxID=1463920 RepID=UPI0006895EC1|nr:DUF6223 family protein [Streptomyces sp. NRRL S-87]
MSVGFVLAAPVAAHVAAQSAPVDAYALTTGRLVGGAAALVALAGVIIGGLALARSAGRTGRTGRTGLFGGRRGAVMSLVAGLTGTVVGALNLAVADGGPGTGNGVIGGAMAVLLGLPALVLGRLTLVRHPRTGRPTSRSGEERAEPVR